MPMAKLELKTPSELLDDIVRLRKALEDIAYMDDFLTGESAKHMQRIARRALTRS